MKPRALAAVALVLLSACGSSTAGAVSVSFDVRLIGQAPFTVRAEGGGRLSPGSNLDHEIVFEATGGNSSVIDDVRWTFAGRRDGGVFATAGHGCGPSLDEETGKVGFMCTEDYRYLIVRPGAPLHERITAFGRVDSKPLATGTFTFRQPITWWRFSGDQTQPQAGPKNDAVVVLTYRVAR